MLRPPSMEIFRRWANTSKFTICVDDIAPRQGYELDTSEVLSALWVCEPSSMSSCNRCGPTRETACHRGLLVLAFCTQQCFFVWWALEGGTKMDVVGYRNIFSFLREIWAEMCLCCKSFLEGKKHSEQSKRWWNFQFVWATVQDSSVADLMWLNFVHLSQILYRTLYSALSQRSTVSASIIRVKYSCSLNY